MRQIIVVAGPTAVGKTKYAIEIAKAFDGEVVSCDSMQLYKYMNIGSAKPTAEEQSQVKHWLVDEIDPKDAFSVARYQEMAKACIEDIFSRGKNAMLVGGTGLYVDSFIKDTDYTETASDDTIRKELSLYALENGNEALHQLLNKIDPESAEAIHPNNVKRVIRAIEYFKLSGEKISDHNKKTALSVSPYDYVYIGLTRNRDELYERIDKRVDIMMAEGLLDEVFSLWKKGCTRDMTSMQALGYKELIHYIEGRCTLGEAIRILKRDSRHYAKRQLTWFGRNKNIKWINLSEIKSADEVAELACRYIENKETEE